ncbi:MAG: DUF3570 domain-containing protein [Myxococcota bacterium]
MTCLLANGASAQVTVGSTTTVYRESGGGLNSTAITPSLQIRGDIKDVFTIRAGWEADIVSGASVAVVDAPGGEVDAITSATKWDDFRNTASGGIGIASEYARIDATYTYGHESDYRSHGFNIVGTAELFDRNTTLTVSYGRGFDRVCNLLQPRAQEAVDRQRLPNADGCFGGDDRESLDLELHTFQGGWTQAWTPILATQLTLTGQVLNGYQGNPYRAVWLGRSAAQENHPENRTRYAGGLAIRLWVNPLRGALQLSGRLYRDTWDIRSATVELAWDQRIAEGLRVRLRGRYYNQTGAAFYSDDYARFPRGQYFTGDRELSPMSNWLIGGRIEYDIPPSDEGSVGPFRSFALIAKFDWIRYDFRDFRYGQVSIPNNRGIAATLGLEAGF